MVAYKYKTFDYIAKPISYDRLEETVIRLFDDINSEPKKYIKLDNKNTLVDASEIQYIKEVFKLSEGEAYFLTTCNRGEGLLKVGEDTAIIAIQPTAKEFEFVETNMNKLRGNN